MSATMVDEVQSRIRARLKAKLAESLQLLLPSATLRHIRGRVTMPGKATAVIGMRRAGKTTFLHQQRRVRLEAGARPEQLPFLNFEDEQLVGMQAEDLGFVVDEHARQFPDLPSDRPVTWCFDEIQLVAGWERFVRRLLDSAGREVLISGSSAALLSRELATAMRGRAWEVLVHPFSFEEALRHQGLAVPATPSALDPAARSQLERSFLDYLTVGGFPEAQGHDPDARRQLLRDYVDVAMLRDIVERHQVSNVVGLRWLVRQLLGNAASRFSVEKFHRALKSQGVSIAKDTAHQLLMYLEDCFLVRTVWIDSDSERRRMVNERKTYPVDPGLIPVFDRTGKANTGHALETAVRIELERRRLEVGYVRTAEGLEVDFLARGAGGMELIQVCSDASASDTAEREIRALLAARAAYPEAGMRLLTATQDGLPQSVPSGVVAQPAYEWMLAE